MSRIEHSIDVEVPVREAYDQWTQFEQFPRFMDGVESVRQLDDTRLHWVAAVAGRRQEWDAEITEQTPDQRIAWTSTTGDRNAGVVDFHRLGDTATRITLTMEVEPSGVVETVGDALGLPSGQVKGDLERFRDHIESRGTATGGWRGEVVQGDTTGSGIEDRELEGATSAYGGGHELDAALGDTVSGGATADDPYGIGGDVHGEDRVGSSATGREEDRVV
jgi:hypothetical protein